jgi:hypothetical protein
MQDGMQVGGRAGREAVFPAGKQARRELGSGRQKQATGQIDRQRQEGK